MIPVANVDMICAMAIYPVDVAMKYVVVSGGVLSGTRKRGHCQASASLLKAAGLRVTSIKIDPYLNSDAGTMSPFKHGEVFVLDDGGEVDLDLELRTLPRHQPFKRQQPDHGQNLRQSH